MSTDAVNQPVHRPRPELGTDDLPIEQKGRFKNRQELEQIVIAAPEVLEKDRIALLAFNEEPVTIIINRTGEKHAPPAIDLWCNGKGAEILVNGRWVETRVLPVGMVVTTKRKYVEILARSKRDTVNTVVTQTKDSETNEVEVFTSSNAPFQVIDDRSPKGVQWLTELLRAG